MILKTLVVGFVASNCYVVGSEATKEGMIIDPGAESKTILQAVDQLGLSISLIVATHSHFDHVGALGKVKERTNAEFAMHKDETGGSLQKFSQGIAAVMGGSFSSLPEPDRLLEEGDILKVGDLSFSVLHTPGHSPGGISLLGDGVVFSGDSLFNFSVGRTDFPGGSHGQLIDSIRTKLMILPDDTVVLPGHGAQTTIGAERRMNPFLRG